MGSAKPESSASSQPPPSVMQPQQQQQQQPSPQSSSSSGCAPAYGQCGGQTWNGATCCEDGCTCTPSGDYYSQCKPPANSGSCGASGMIYKYTKHTALVEGERPWAQEPALIAGILSMSALLSVAAAAALMMRRRWDTITGDNQPLVRSTLPSGNQDLIGDEVAP